MRRGQTAFLAVAIIVTTVFIGAFLFPSASDQEPPKSRLNAQVIRPAKISIPARRANAATRAKSPVEEFWQVISLGGKRIGYSRTRFERVTAGEAVHIRTTSEMHISVLRFTQSTKMSSVTRTLESATGDLLSFDVKNVNGKDKTRMQGRREGNYLRVDTTESGRTTKRYHAWKAGIKSPFYQDRLLRTFPMKAGEIRRYQSFLPTLGRTTEVRLAAENLRSVKLPDGTLRRLLRVRVTQAVSPTESVYAYLDKLGRPVLVASEFVGKQMVSQTVSRAEALKSIPGKEFDLGLQTVLRTTDLRKAHKRNRIVYRIQMTGSDPADHLATNDRQQIKRIDQRTIDLTATRSKLPTRVIHFRTDRQYLDASKFLDASDTQVRAHARRAAGYQTDPIKIATHMEKYVRDRLKTKNFSTALGTASQVARKLSGDCTEHAVLLAAMLRVRRVPSRIAIGLIYDERVSGFVAHMWTEARLGEKWYPFDGTRGEGMIGPGYIKLSHASFSDKSEDPITAFVPLMNVLGKWRIEIRSADDVPGRRSRQLRNRDTGLFPRR